MEGRVSDGAYVLQVGKYRIAQNAGLSCVGLQDAVIESVLNDAAGFALGVGNPQADLALEHIQTGNLHGGVVALHFLIGSAA